jgi:hypothetical protein
MNQNYTKHNQRKRSLSKIQSKSNKPKHQRNERTQKQTYCKPKAITTKPSHNEVHTQPTTVKPKTPMATYTKGNPIKTNNI